MSDKTPRKLATRRRILVGTGGLLATGLGCSSVDDGSGGASSLAGGTSGGRAGSSDESRGVDASVGQGGASSDTREAGGVSGDASTTSIADAFSEAGVAVVIDCHTHFFDPTRNIPATRDRPVPWPDPASVLYRRTMPADYEQLATPLGIAGMVVIEASPWIEDNQWILDLAATTPAITAFVGNLSEVMGQPGFDTALARFGQNPLFRGIRVAPGSFVAANTGNFVALGDRGLMIDVLGSPGDLMAIAAFAAKVPTLRIVIDHVGGLSIDGKAPPAAWVAGMKAAASQPNVYCKVSNLVESTGATQGDAPSDVTFYRPVLDALWASFGEDRLVFGSNWPVSGPAAPLSTVVSIVKTYFMEKGPDAMDKYFYRNGKAAYGFAR